VDGKWSAALLQATSSRLERHENEPPSYSTIRQHAEMVHPTAANASYFSHPMVSLLLPEGGMSDTKPAPSQKSLHFLVKDRPPSRVPALSVESKYSVAARWDREWIGSLLVTSKPL